MNWTSRSLFWRRAIGFPRTFRWAWMFNSDFGFCERVLSALVLAFGGRYWALPYAERRKRRVKGGGKR